MDAIAHAGFPNWLTVPGFLLGVFAEYWPADGWVEASSPAGCWYFASFFCAAWSDWKLAGR